MNKLRQASRDIHISDNADNPSIVKGAVHHLSRVLVTFMYILLVVSFPGYDLAGLAGMVLYLPVHIIWHEISVGMLSMIALMVKGVFCVAASCILAVTTGIGQICYALRLLHIPEEIVTVIMLMHRYLMVLIKQVERMQQAYRLRAPNQKGLRFKVWGSFVGLLLLRSIDRSEEVYESMKLRGFQGRVQHSVGKSSKGKSTFLKLIVGLLTGYEGEISVQGQSVIKKNLTEIRKKAGYVFQDSDSQR